MFDTMVGASREVAASNPGELSEPGLISALELVAQARERADAALLLHAASALERHTWKADGGGSPVSWLAARCSLTERDGRATVRAARLLCWCERLAKLLAAGEVTADHVRVLARVVIGARRAVFERDRDLLCDLALRLPVDELGVVATRWASYADDQLGRGEPSAIHDQRGVWVSYHGSMGELHARGLSADIAALVHRLDDHAPLDPPEALCRRSRSQRRFDALCQLVDRGASNHRSGRRPSPDRAFTILVDSETIRGGFEPRGRCETSAGVPVPRVTAERYACDSLWRALVFSRSGEVLRYGRGRRLFSPAQRAAIMARDRRCIVTGCSVPATDCDIHHLRAYHHGGPTDIENGAAVCWAHHALLHEHGWQARRAADGSWFAEPP
ncbi:HNH endonuclease signature motif containing protein [Rhabdothermincola sp.]|uniref:HNH endonuclease signature motif containing protein n=1 Tax=Rhabdothermincola sp. TaxID=2820405 RepID=UPI002FE21E47